MFQVDYNADNRTHSSEDAYRTLVDLAIHLNPEVDFELISEKICGEIGRLLGAGQVLLFLVDAARQELFSYQNSNSPVPVISQPLDRGLLGKVATRGKTVNLRDARREHLFEAQIFDLSVRSALATPVTCRDGEIIGVLVATNSRRGYFTQQEEELIQYAGKMLGSAGERSKILGTHVEQNKKLNHEARHDVLTGLPNRIALHEKLLEKLEEAEREGHSLGVLFLDLDRFKLINDSLGHLIGDMLLIQVAQRLKEALRPGDIVARIGGDEFVIVLAAVKSPQSIVRVSHKIISNLQQPFFVEGQELYISGSIGISLYPDHGQDVNELLRNADTAMYRVKDNGKNNYHFFDEQLSGNDQKRLWLVTQLHKALELKELILYYQPQLNLSNGSLAGMEALVRWRHPELGVISPGDFIPMAEETGLIVPIGRWVMEEACRQCLEWHQRGYDNLKVSVNVSALQFNRADFIPGVLSAIQKTGLRPNFLELELTEGILIGNIDETVQKLQELKRAGVRIAIDDFGTGYSSLSYLQKLPIDILKIDKSFVFPVGDPTQDTQQNRALLKTISTLGHSLGMQLIAEGVENKKQLSVLWKLGCQEIQGYLYSPPLNPADFEKQFLTGKAEKFK